MALVYAAVSDVQARVPGRTISTATKPTTAQVEQWLTEGEGLLTGALSYGGISTPITDTTGITMMKSWATDYAEAHTRMAWASTAGDENKDGQTQLDKFDKLIADIYDHPERYAASLNSGSAGGSTSYLRGPNTDTDADDYIGPKFESDEVY